MAERSGTGWKEAAGHVFNEIVIGGIVGPWVRDKLGILFTTPGAPEVTREEAAEARQRARERRERLERERSDLMRDLLWLKHRDKIDVDAIVDLLTELNQPPRFIRVFNRRYTEEWLVQMLVKVEVGHRGWVYPVLNKVLKDGNRERFIALLETYDNDEWIQFIAVAWDVMKELPSQIDEAVGHMLAQMMGVSVDEATRRLEDTYYRLGGGRPYAPPSQRSPLRQALRDMLPW